MRFSEILNRRSLADYFTLVYGLACPEKFFMSKPSFCLNGRVCKLHLIQFSAEIQLIICNLTTGPTLKEYIFKVLMPGCVCFYIPDSKV